MRQTLILLLGIVLALATQSAIAQTTNYTSVADAATELKLTGLLAAVGKANLTAALSDPNLQAIILAPTNEAFDEVQGELGGFNPTQLASILKYHVLGPQATEAAMLQAGQSYDTLIKDVITDATTAITTVTTKLVNDSLIYVGGVAPGAFASVNVSYVAGKSRIYLINHVLIPPVKELQKNGSAPFYTNLAAAVSGTPVLSTLLAAVGFAGDEIGSVLSNTSSMFTLFAPVNDAFTGLLGSLNLSLATLTPAALTNAGVDLSRVLYNHVVVYPVDLVRSNTSVPSTLPTATSQADSLSVTNRGSNVTVRGAGNTESFNILQTIFAGKSIIYLTNGVLLPAQAAGPGGNGTTNNSTVMSPPNTTPTGFPNPPPGASPPPAAAATASISTSLLAATAFASVFLFALLF